MRAVGPRRRGCRGLERSWHTHRESASPHSRNALALGQGECQRAAQRTPHRRAHCVRGSRHGLRRPHPAAQPRRLGPAVGAAAVRRVPHDGPLGADARRGHRPGARRRRAHAVAPARQGRTPSSGTSPSGMLFTAAGLEQATRLSVAAHHARRYRDAGSTRVADLTCGIGADAMAFAGIGLRVLATDVDEATAAIATVNLRHFPDAEVRHGDGLALDLEAEGVDGVYADPARRTSSGSRVFDPSAYEPSLDAVLAVRERGARARPQARSGHPAHGPARRRARPVGLGGRRRRRGRPVVRPARARGARVARRSCCATARRTRSWRADPDGTPAAVGRGRRLPVRAGRRGDPRRARRRARRPGARPAASTRRSPT